MKKLSKTIATSLFALTSGTLGASADDRVVVLSNTMPEASARIVLAQSKRIFASMAPGDSVTFIDGPSGSFIAGVDLPAGAEGAEILDSRRKTIDLFGEPMNDVQAFLVPAAHAADALTAAAVPLPVPL
ncbi:MAG: hypothetical protein V2I76_06775, partial [Roseobacter sp.]|nr:hypothetical protein [Roseobacter sp.]